MALTERSGHRENPGNSLVSVPITAAEVIFDGALVAIAAAGALENWAGDTVTAGNTSFFLGLARITEQTGVSAAAGESKIGTTALNVEAAVDISGVILKSVSVAGASDANVGNLVFATDENTLTMTPTPGGAPIGWLTKFFTDTTANVKLFTPGEYRAHVATVSFTDRTGQYDAEEGNGVELLDGSGNGNHLEDNLSVPGGVTGKIGNARGPCQSGDQHFRKAYAAGGPWDIRGLTSCTWCGWYQILDTQQSHAFSIDDRLGSNAEGQALVLIPRETNTGPEGPWVFMGDGITRWTGASLKIHEATVALNTWQFFAAGYDAGRNKLFGFWGRAEGESYYNETDGVVGGFGYDGTRSEALIGRFNGGVGTAEINVDHAVWFNGRALTESELKKFFWNNHAGIDFADL